MLKPEQQTMLSIIKSRMSGMKFTSAAQIRAMREGLNKIMDEHGTAFDKKKADARTKAQADRIAKDIFRGPFRYKWAQLNLREGMIVKTNRLPRGVKVISVTEHWATTHDGKKETMVGFEQITAVQIDGVWKDTYELAAKGC